MYLKGYQIRDNENKNLTLRKWDFGGDISHTNRAWNRMLAEVRALPINSYPLSIIDLDREESNIVKISNQKEFEFWLKNDFDKKGH